MYIYYKTNNYYRDAHEKLIEGRWQFGNNNSVQLLTKFIEIVSFNYSSAIHERIEGCKSLLPVLLMPK
jgi:hypothetical protein